MSYLLYFDGRELVEASLITVVFSGALLIVCSVFFCVEHSYLLKVTRTKTQEWGEFNLYALKKF